MGNWNISVQGVGAHHNTDYPRDANVIAKKFVDELLAAGHYVEKATFTHGGCEVLLPSKTPRQLYEAYCASSSWKNFRGEPCPQWDDLTEAVRTHWAAVAEAAKGTHGGT